MDDYSAAQNMSAAGASSAVSLGGGRRSLVVGLSSGLVCLLDLKSGKVVRAIQVRGCQMTIARFLDRMYLALRASGLWLRYAAEFDPFLSLDCAPTPSTLAQSKERKGSNFAIWQP